MTPTDIVTNADEAAASDERTILGVKYPLAAALCCAGIGSSAVAAVPMFGTSMRSAVMLLALALFGMIGALGALALYAVECPVRFYSAGSRSRSWPASPSHSRSRSASLSRASVRR